MNLGERFIKDNDYDKGYAAAIEDACNILQMRTSETREQMNLLDELHEEIKALLSRGSR